MLDIVEERDCIKLKSIFLDELKVKLIVFPRTSLSELVVTGPLFAHTSQNGQNKCFLQVGPFTFFMDTGKCGMRDVQLLIISYHTARCHLIPHFYLNSH